MKLTSTDLLNITNQLKQLSTREQGIELLKDLNKTQLSTVCNNLFKSASGTKEQLIDSAVERAIGLRIRQESFSNVLRS